MPGWLGLLPASAATSRMKKRRCRCRCRAIGLALRVSERALGGLCTLQGKKRLPRASLFPLLVNEWQQCKLGSPLSLIKVWWDAKGTRQLHTFLSPNLKGEAYVEQRSWRALAGEIQGDSAIKRPPIGWNRWGPPSFFPGHFCLLLLL